MPNKQIKEGGVDFSSSLQGTVLGGEDLVAGSGGDRSLCVRNREAENSERQCSAQFCLFGFRTHPKEHCHPDSGQVFLLGLIHRGAQRSTVHGDSRPMLTRPQLQRTAKGPQSFETLSPLPNAEGVIFSASIHSPMGFFPIAQMQQLARTADSPQLTTVRTSVGLQVALSRSYTSNTEF